MPFIKSIIFNSLQIILPVQCTNSGRSHQNGYYLNSFTTLKLKKDYADFVSYQYAFNRHVVNVKKTDIKPVFLFQIKFLKRNAYTEHNSITSYVLTFIARDNTASSITIFAPIIVFTTVSSANISNTGCPCGQFFNIKCFRNT